MINRKIVAGTIISGAVNLLFTGQAFAQVDLKGTYPSPIKDLNQTGGFISSLLSNSIMFSGVMLLILIMLGGLGMIVNAGSQKQNENTKGAITYTFFGFLIIFAAYWIIQIVELIFGVKILS
jgi:hypothetical protein